MFTISQKAFQPLTEMIVDFEYQESMSDKVQENPEDGDNPWPFFLSENTESTFR